MKNPNSIIIDLFIYSPTLLYPKRRKTHFMYMSTSNEAMCVTKCWLYSHLVLKNRLQDIPKNKKPISSIDMVGNISEWWGNNMAWWLLETKIQWNPHIYDSPTDVNLPQFDSHSPGGTKNLVKEKR